jgi:Holliday junction resolvase RusA-like endonuclease
MNSLFGDDSLDIKAADFEMVFNMRPVPKGSVRFDGKRSFLPDKTRKAMHDIKMLSSQYKDQLFLDDKLESPTDPMFSGAVAVWIDFAFIRPKSVKADKRPHPCVKPDIDNLVKLLLDGLQPHILKDDCLVCEMHLRKLYCPVESIKIKIKEI